MDNKLKKEIENDLNKLMNKFIIRQHEYLNQEIKATITNYLADFYIPNGKIYDYFVESNYPNIEIIIQPRKFEEHFQQPLFLTIRLIRFERIKKLRKLNEIEN